MSIWKDTHHQYVKFEEEMRGKRGHPKRSKGRILVFNQERHMELDIIFGVHNDLDKKSVKTCGTPEYWSLNRS